MRAKLLPIVYARSIFKQSLGSPKGWVRRRVSFELGPGAAEEIAEKLSAWLTLDPARRSRASGALSELARARFGWEGVANGVIAAAEGRLQDLAAPS